LLIYVLILPGIYLTARARHVGGYHLFVAVTGLALLGAVHFVPTGGQESPIHDIYIVYESPVAGMLALVILASRPAWRSWRQPPEAANEPWPIQH
jgi:hypothetical protein